MILKAFFPVAVRQKCVHVHVWLIFTENECDSKAAEQLINIAAPALLREHLSISASSVLNHQSGSLFCTSDTKTPSTARQKRRAKALWKTRK